MLTALVVVFTGSHPNDVGILRVDGQATDALGSVTIKNGLIGCASIRCFPNTTIRSRQVIFGFVVGVHGDVYNSTAGGRWTNHPKVHLVQNGF